MSVTEIQLYKTLRGKIGDEAAQEMVNYVKAEINSEFMECKQVFLTKDDKVELIGIIKNDKAELISVINNYKFELKEDISNLRTDLLRTIYIVNIVNFLAIMGALIGLMAFFLKHQ